MKLHKALTLLFLFGFFLFLGNGIADAKKAPYRQLCLGIDGKFSADNKWKGGAIQVGCAGDDGRAAPNQSQACTGEVQTVRPGQSFRLTKCSCFGSNKGCLKVGKELRLGPLRNGKKLITVVKKIQDMPAFKNNKCRVNNTNNICGSNGKHIKGNVKISCNPARPTPTRRPTPTPTGGPTLTPTPTLSPTPSICPGPKKVTNVKVSCPNCFSQNEEE